MSIPVKYPTLSDDELLALLLNADPATAVLLPQYLPTVDLGDEQQTVAAVLRGQRSLALRELDADRDAHVVAEVLRSTQQQAYLNFAADDLEARSLFGATVWREIGHDDHLIQSISPIGTHGFQVQHRSEQRDEIADVMLQVTHTAPGPTPPPGTPRVWTCFRVLHEGIGGAASMLAATYGACVRVEVAPDGSIGERTEVPLNNIVDEVTRLVGGRSKADSTP